MQENASPSEYILAIGPEGLRNVLDVLLETSQRDPVFAANEHYILYQLRDQRSIIKVDTSKQPFQFWYNDLLGRPMTRLVEETIALFLWEKCGVKERYLKASDRD
jgi:hypothetical protein